MPSNPRQVPLVESAGDELRALLSPVSSETFVREYWARKPLFVKGFRDKYRGIFDRDAFIRAVAQPGPVAQDFLRASFDKKDRPRKATSVDASSIAFNAAPEQAVALFKAGATLCATQMEARVPTLGPLAAAVKRQLGYPGRVTFNAYLSPPGAGFNWHFDGRISSTLQIEGTKRWRFSKKPAVAWPRGNGALRADGSGAYVDGRPVAPWEQIAPLDPEDVDEALLEPGDLLILPAGAWHDACGGDEGSLALNLSFTPVSYTTLLRELIDRLLSADPDWRGPWPLLPAVGRPAGEVDRPGLEAVSHQLQRAAEALRSLAADDMAMVEIWASFVQATGAAPVTARAPDTSAVEKHDRLRVRADGAVYARLADGGKTLCVFFGAAGRVVATGTSIPFLQRMLSIGSFIASDGSTWSDPDAPTSWNELGATLTHLLREGLLERVPPERG